MTSQTSNCHFQAIPCVIEKFRLTVFALYIKVITQNSPDKKFRSFQVFLFIFMGGDSVT